MADREVDFLLIGGGIAAATCAQTLRAESATGSVLLVARELDPPYHRPPITKGYLGGTETKDDGLIELPDDVEVLTRTSVMALDVAARTATLSNRDVITYRNALLATGAMVRRLQIDGVHLDGIHYLRAHGNADSLIEDAEEVAQIVCVGGSYIGSESAATLTTLGKSVTVVLQEEQPMERAFGLQVGGWVRGVLEAHGIEVIGDAEVERFEGDGDRVARVVLAGGRELEAELVVAGVGVTPDVMLAKKAGLEIGERGGVRADAQLRAHGADGLWVAGDIAEYDSVVHGGAVIRVEHEEHAAAQGRTVARNMLGAGADHDEVPYFFSDLADWASFEYVGPALAWDDEVIEGDMAEGEFTVWYVAGGKVVAMLSAGGHGDIDRGKRLIVEGGAPPAND
ncbi:NAD(P)/FAD-dependent oxidoreductase [Conexibacter woesei]|uniref:NAD(P)/FAD-dependent oxidoreductase n=1 Tax=Conexibacter woesei TaxID=191495 RepID=UPI0004186556|nr:FAD-dependent oxidoreductase [Conexibacter woesei]